MGALHLLSLLVALTPADVPNPRASGGWVSDGANVIAADAEQRINGRLDALARDLGVEVALVTVQDVDGTPKEFATELFNRWGVGNKEANNGLLVLLVMGQRRLEMETGYGLEPILPDGWLGSMQQEAMVPAFKRGAFGEGLEVGLQRVEERIRANPEEAREGTRGGGAVAAVGGGVAHASSGYGMWVTIGGAGLLVFLAFIALGALLAKRERTCPKCRIDMRLLDEVEDDAKLEPGQVVEEKIGSVDYRVYICGKCQLSRVVANRKWFSGYSKCPECKYRTVWQRSQTIVHATYEHGGEVRVEQQCKHCHHAASWIRYTSRLESSSSSSSSSFDSSSSSSSSSSSFGGGSSGGGGAGSSW